MDESKARSIVQLLQAHYEVPLFEAPTAASTKAINSFYQAKYMMFTCFDSVNYVGDIDIEPTLISYWERGQE